MDGMIDVNLVSMITCVKRFVF